MTNSNNSPDSGSHSKKEGWSRNKKIGVGIIVLISIIAIASIAATPGPEDEKVVSHPLSQQPVTPDEGQPIMTAPDGLQP